jgi:putative oxidoreductase
MGFTKALGRAAFGGFFLYSGINHFREIESMKAYAAMKEIPYPEVAVKATGSVLVASGLSLILGIKPRIGATGAAAFLAAVSPAMHNFWKQTDPGQQKNEMIHFLKNMALLAAALSMSGDESAGDCCDRELA